MSSLPPGSRRPTVVLVPGFSQTATSWRGVGRVLEESCDVVALDVPAHDTFAATATALGNAGGRAVYAGYSMGGRLALRLALDRPDLVSALVLVSSTAGIADKAARRERIASDEALAESVERDGVGAFLERWLDQRLFETLPREAAMLDDRRRGNTVRRLAHQLRELGPGAQEPLWDRLAELAMPVLLIAGGYDRAYSETAQRMATAIGSNAEVAILPRTGHAVHLEQPKELAQLLTSWAGAVGPVE